MVVGNKYQADVRRSKIKNKQKPPKSGMNDIGMQYLEGEKKVARIQ